MTAEEPGSGQAPPGPPSLGSVPQGAVPLGATPREGGVDFALFSDHATAVVLCLFDTLTGPETGRVELERSDCGVWQGRVEGLRPGQFYGYRVFGPYAPEAGHRFNPNKLLLDPYARGIAGGIAWDDATCGYRRGDPAADLSYDARDSAPFVPRSVVPEPEPPRRHARPGHSWRDTVIYEAHVRGLTRLHPDVPEADRGTYRALGHPAVIAHLQTLGATALELLPVHHFVDDRFLLERGLRNYWGYSTLGFFCPEPRYGRAGDLRAAVAALHEAGIEVILDVVYNHTAELDELGPTLCFRGIDNASYYKLRPEAPRFDFNWTGTGNTLDLAHPRVAALALESLRYWAESFGVDGFRFDLAPILGRNPYGFDPDAPFLRGLVSDPLLSRLKLIAEPWDIGPDGYRLGAFPAPFGEWNDRFRDTVRSFWRGDPGQAPRLADALAGSRAIFGSPGRSPFASVNCVATHDGFPLADVVAYEQRHNEANGEGNRDGHGHNLSRNYGVEGPTADSSIRAVRSRQIRNMLATLLLSQGTPMLLGGDEIARSQQGNNNAYCQDNPISWIDWAGAGADPDLVAFVAHCAGLRRALPALRRESFLTGEPVGPDDLPDALWLSPAGVPLGPAEWEDPDLSAFGLHTGHAPEDGPPVLILFNAGEEDVAVSRPARPEAGTWSLLLDSTRPDGRPEGSGRVWDTPGTFPLASRSVVLLRWSR